jgi:hypothetical protein
MIDAARFSSSYTAFWNITTPTCEHLVRKINLTLYERENPPLSSSDSGNRALIAEFAFSLFTHMRLAGGITGATPQMMDAALNEANGRISRLRGIHGEAKDLNESQISEGYTIAVRLNSFFPRPKHRIILRTILSGCGFIDRYEADVQIDDVMYEVKTVDRPFRSNDLRQLITYAALNAIKNGNDISKLGVYNPRRGISFLLPINFIAKEISGKSELDLFEDIYQAISGNGISR